MTEFLHQLGYDPLAYWLFSGATFLLWIVSAVLPWRPAGSAPQRLNTPLFFGIALLVAMAAFRWPAVFYFRAVNPDEPQFLAGAITMLARGGIWWNDATTSGPLVVLPLALPRLAGLPVDFGTGRIVALLLAWGGAIFVYLILKHAHGDRMARLLVLPLACWAMFQIFWDLVPYCSESAPLCLCALAAWLSTTAFRPDGRLRDRWRLAACGAVLGLLPFSKLQALPLGAAIGLAALVWIWRQPATEQPRLGRDLTWLLAGVAAGFGAMCLGLWRSGYAADFYQSYVVHNLIYAQARDLPWSASAYVLSYLTEITWGFFAFHYGLLLLLIVGLRALRDAAWRPLLLGWLLFLGAYYAVLAPGRLYPHYLIFLTVPLGLLVGLQFGYLVQPTKRTRRTPAALWTLFLLAGVGVQVVDRIWDRHDLHKLAPAESPRTAASRLIDQLKQPGDTLAVWGWRPELYVDTQLPQATREAHTDGQLHAGSQRDYFRARFLADLRTSRPAFFVDTIGAGDFIRRDPAREGHESFRALDDFVRQEYALVSQAEPIRVYLRRDRRR